MFDLIPFPIQVHTQKVMDEAHAPPPDQRWKIKKTTNAGKTCYKIEAVSLVLGMSVTFDLLQI